MRPLCLLTITLLLTPACTGAGGDEPARSETATRVAAAEPGKAAAPGDAKAPPPVKDAKAGPEPVAVNPVAVEPVPEPVAVAEPEEPAPAAELPVPPKDIKIPVVPVQAITATPATPSWREVMRPAEPLVFEPVTRGVLARSAAGYHDIDASGALVLRPEIEAPKAPVLGSWPDNAWYIEARKSKLKGDRADLDLKEVRLMRLRGDRRWVPQTYKGQQRFEDFELSFQIAGKGGMIVASETELTRVDDHAVNPVPGLSYDGSLMGFFETRSGKIYTVRNFLGVNYVQRDCADLECVTREARQLPFEGPWSFSKPVTRQQDSISGVAEINTPTGRQIFLLHYDAAGWTLESIASIPVGLWPTKDGGLWAMVGEQLLHRDPAGAWREIALPERAKSPSMAMLRDFSELWLAATVGDATVVFATDGNARSSAAGATAPAP